MEKLKDLYVSGDMKWKNCFGEQSGNFLNDKHRVTMWAKILLGICPREMKIYGHKSLVQECS
jgi:hypothetical protein